MLDFGVRKQHLTMDILKLLGFRQKRVVRSPSLEMLTDKDKARQLRFDAELVMHLSDCNGFIREEALKRVAELLPPQVLPHLMPRINDWVPEVRSAAHQAVEAYLHADKFEEFVDALPGIYWLRSCRRGNHAVFIERIEKYLIQLPRAFEIPSLMTKRKGVQARSLYDLAWKYDLAPKTELIKAGLAAKDVRTIRRACRELDHLAAHERLAIGTQLLRGRSLWLRFEGLRILADLDQDAAKEIAKTYLLAEHTLLRQLAENLTGYLADELSGIRQEALRNPRSSQAALRTAIKLSGVAKDMDSAFLIEKYLDHQLPVIRGSALLALSRISPGKYNQFIYAYLQDETAAVSRSAVQAFIESGLSLKPFQWQTYVRKTSVVGHFLRLTNLARRLNKWEHLGILLEYDVEGKFPDLVKRQLLSWCDKYNRSFLPPDPEQLRWIKGNLAKYIGTRPSKTAITFYLP